MFLVRCKGELDAAEHPLIEIEQLVDAAVTSGSELVVITGGEPAMYNLEPLTALLKAQGLKCCIETSGAHPLTGDWHWICFSPKKFKEPVESIYPVADELKIIIFNKHDFKWAEAHAAKLSANCRLYLQPEWGKSAEMTPLIVDFVKSNPQWSISLQTHKYMDIP